jgi:hypothetical protein
MLFESAILLRIGGSLNGRALSMAVAVVSHDHQDRHVLRRETVVLVCCSARR